MKFVSYHAIDAHKLLGALGPRWQLHVGDDGAVLHHPQVVTVGVDEHLGKVEELWDQFLQGSRTQSRGENLHSHIQPFSFYFTMQKTDKIKFMGKQKDDTGH